MILQSRGLIKSRDKLNTLHICFFTVLPLYMCHLYSCLKLFYNFFCCYRKTHRKTSVSESLFNKVAEIESTTLLKREYGGSILLWIFRNFTARFKSEMSLNYTIFEHVKLKILTGQRDTYGNKINIKRICKFCLCLQYRYKSNVNETSSGPLCLDI